MNNEDKKNSRVEIVLFDAMYTIFEAKKGRKKLLAQVFSDALKVSIEPKALWNAHREIRRKMPPTADFRSTWRRWNKEIVKFYKENIGNDEGFERSLEPIVEAIHYRILSDTNLYEVKKDILKLIKHCKSLKLKLGMATNQYSYNNLPFLKTFNLKDYFDQSLIFTSDKMTTAEVEVSKPNQLFYQKILEKLKVCPEKVVLVGNSPKNDGPATKTGIRVILLDRSGEAKKEFYNSVSSSKINKDLLFFCSTPTQILRLIKKWRKK